MTSKTSQETYLPQLSQCHVQHTSFIPDLTELYCSQRNACTPYGEAYEICR